MADIHFYVDDSGTRHPDHDEKPKTARDWFALGGILINSEDEDVLRHLHAELCARWNITYPLHSEHIRFKRDDFVWLRELEQDEQDRFYRELGDLLASIPVLALACVIDRPGYNARYREKYGRDRWSLCKTSFSVIAERAAKFAISRGRRLRVYPERSDPDSERKLRHYYDQLRAEGMPFAGEGAAKYQPLSQEELSATLREFRLKYKSSPPMQIADLYLYPICRSGYVAYRPMDEFKANGKLIDSELDAKAIPELGIKYSCFELVAKA